MRNEGFLLSLVALLTILPFGLVSQETAIAAEEGPYVVRGVAFDITGLTMDFVLRRKADVTIGASFASKEALESYIADKKQLLLNERVLAQVDASYEAVPAQSGGYDVILRFATRDSWNILALPYLNYNSNTGLLVSLRARDYNFLGSMQTLVLNLDFTQDEQWRNAFGGYLSCGIPFRFLDHEWSANASEDIRYFPDGRPMKSLSSASIGITFPELGPPITLQATQEFAVNPDSVLDDLDPYILTSRLSLSSSIALSGDIGKLGPISYEPSATASRIWRFDQSVRADRQGTVVSFSQGLSLGRVNWIRNMNDGLSFSLKNVDSYNFFDDLWVVDFDASALVFATWEGMFGAKGRVQAIYRPMGKLRTGLGSNLRGIRDYRITGDAGAFVNVDLPLKLFDFPAHLLIKERWLDFELQFSPFIDAAIVRPGPQASLTSKDLWYSAGLEFLAFPEAVRSFIVRASLGFDLDAIVRNRDFTVLSPRDGAVPWEVSFGLGLFYP